MHYSSQLHKHADDAKAISNVRKIQTECTKSLKRSIGYDVVDPIEATTHKYKKMRLDEEEIEGSMDEL